MMLNLISGFSRWFFYTAKQPISLDDIVYLERAVGHPLTKPVIEEPADAYVVHLVGVYWAMNHMLREALGARGQLRSRPLWRRCGSRSSKISLSGRRR